MRHQSPSFEPGRWREFPKQKSGTFPQGLFILFSSLLASILAITTPQPAFAGLEFCNRTGGASALTVALAYYNFGISHARSGKDGTPVLNIVLNPRWSIRGWWEIPQNECITAIQHDLNQPNYYYYVRSQDGLYDIPGNYSLCAHKYSRFHIEYAINDGKLVQILALKPSGIDSAPVNAPIDLEKACAELGYQLLPFNQLPVGDTEEFTLTFID